MYYALNLAKSAMSDAEINEAIAFQRQAEKLEKLEAEAVEAATPDAPSASSAHKPNLLNTVVFLVETAQQVTSCRAVGPIDPGVAQPGSRPGSRPDRARSSPGARPDLHRGRATLRTVPAPPRLAAARLGARRHASSSHLRSSPARRLVACGRLR